VTAPMSPKDKVRYTLELWLLGLEMAANGRLNDPEAIDEIPEILLTANPIYVIMALNDSPYGADGSDK